MSHVKKEFQDILDRFWNGTATPTSTPTRTAPNPATIKVRAARPQPERKAIQIPIYVLLVNGNPVSSSFSKSDIEYEHHLCLQGDEFEDVHNEYAVVEGFVKI